ncbi:AAA ATPase [Emticicia oligotrophica DSM 17448]|uniref:AAA ATPase n=1 Tax=Emticicia oligotrophica (strain DSM 17448 / CIP 109782 / MTCC 6937 / GPTSA100-15) TaxID=929562 RepID=A0ABM5N3T8_EMTOG|nr:AAA family ATPase [Emticicia oligotrophica]AFK04114.1 AAA ATPase [Emticicia oligotrophica DSM 17448]
MQLQQAERKKAFIKMALQSCAGGGKTYSALLLAHGLCNDWQKIAVIDAENNSASLYAHLGAYNVLDLQPPFSPERYIQAIQTCIEAEMEVIIIDGISQEWDYIIEEHSKLTGNSFTNWSKFTPRHNAFIQKMLQTKAHIIATIRTKQDYVLNEKNGKMVPEKVGLKGVMRDSTDYEFTLVFDLDVKHYATASKDRTSLFMDLPAFQISQDTGKILAAWCNQGKAQVQEREDTYIEPDALLEQIYACQDVDTLKDLYMSLDVITQKEYNADFSTRKNQLVYVPPQTYSTNGTHRS